MAWVSEAAKIADRRVGQLQLLGGQFSPATAASCGPRPIRSASHFDARRRQRLPVPAQPVRGGGEAQAGRRPGERHVADEADPAVPQRDQVPGGQLPARHVIDDRLRHSAGDRVHADQRHPGPAELGQLLAGQRQADRQHAVGTMRGQQRLQMAVTRKRRCPRCRRSCRSPDRPARRARWPPGSRSTAGSCARRVPLRSGASPGPAPPPRDWAGSAAGRWNPGRRAGWRARTWSPPLSTRDTVPTPTPASAATSAMVTRRPAAPVPGAFPESASGSRAPA